MQRAYREYRLRYGKLATTLELEGKTRLKKRLDGFWQDWAERWDVTGAATPSPVQRVLDGASTFLRSLATLYRRLHRTDRHIAPSRAEVQPPHPVKLAAASPPPRPVRRLKPLGAPHPPARLDRTQSSRPRLCAHISPHRPHVASASFRRGPARPRALPPSIAPAPPLPPGTGQHTRYVRRAREPRRYVLLRSG